MVTTVLLALVVAAAVALPPVFMKGSFSDVFGGGKESSKETAESSSGADNYDPDAGLLGIADPEGFVSDLAGLTDRMPGYQWKVFDSADELEQFVEAGGDGGFLLTGKFTYTYVVQDRSLLDSQNSEFSEIYTSYGNTYEVKEHTGGNIWVNKYVVNNTNGKEIRNLAK